MIVTYKLQLQTLDNDMLNANLEKGSPQDLNKYLSPRGMETSAIVNTILLFLGAS